MTNHKHYVFMSNRALLRQQARGSSIIRHLYSCHAGLTINPIYVSRRNRDDNPARFCLPREVLAYRRRQGNRNWSRSRRKIVKKVNRTRRRRRARCADRRERNHERRTCT